MQKLLIVALAATLLVSCKQEAVKEEVIEIAANSAWKTSHLNGMVKSIEESKYTADSTGTIGEMDSCCIEVNIYNDKGYMEKYLEKNSNGETVSEVFFAHREDGKFKSATRMEEGKKVWERIAEYDDDGNVSYAFDSDTSGNMTYYYSDMIRNDIGQPLKGKMHSADSTYMGTWSRIYDDGFEIGRSWVDSTGNELDKRIGELNDKGFLAKMTRVVIGEEGPVTTVMDYQYDTYDENGNWTQRTVLDGNGNVTNLEKRIYTYYQK